jgi:hypothetical protein
MDSHNKESRNVRISGQCKGLPAGTRALGRVPLHCLRARLSSAPVVRIQARSLGHAGEGGVTQHPNRPARGSASTVRLGGLVRAAGDRGCFSAWNAQGRGMCRAAQPARAAGGSEAHPGAARSRPPRRPMMVQRRLNLVDVTDPRSPIMGRSPPAWVRTVRERPHHPFASPHRARSRIGIQPCLSG